MEKKLSCCFTGHRNIPYCQYENILNRLYKEITKLIKNGIIYYYVGGAMGLDTLAAKVVLSLKSEYPQIKLILVIPCINQTKNWSNYDTDVYRKVKEKCDKVIYTSFKYTKDCMLNRNRYMVDNSSICICYQRKYTGGTAYTVNYALRKGLQIINI